MKKICCSRCGVKPFGRGCHEEELASASVVYQDGRNNRWESPPAETRYL